MAKRILIFICMIVPLHVFAQLPQPQKGVTSPSEIPGINDPSWQTITSWPDQIFKGEIRYSIKYRGKSIEFKGQSATEIEEIDRKQNYSANYTPNLYNDEVHEEDYYYGPFFAWRPDGSLYLKQMTDEYGNHESYYLYPDGSHCQATTYDKSRDLFMMSFYENDGTLAGYYIIQNEWTPDAPIKSEYWWNGEFVSEEELKSLSCGFSRKCMDNKKPKCAEKLNKLPQNIFIDASKVNRELRNLNAKTRPRFSDGTMEGIVISSIQPNSIFHFMKIQNGDVILSCNNKPISSMADSFEFYKMLESQSELTLRIKRDSTLSEVTYIFK